MRRVLLVSEAKAVGGAEVYLERLATHLKQFAVVMAVPKRLSAWSEHLADLGIDVAPYDASVLGLGFLRGLVGGVDLVHLNLPNTYDGRSGIMAWLLHRDTPVVVTEHLTRLPRSRRREVLKRITRTAVDTVVCVSDASAEPLRVRGVRRVVVIPNAVPDPGPPQALPVGPLRIGTLSSLEERKRLDVLIGALGRVPDALLSIAGDGPLRSQLQEQAAASPASSRIRFLGAVRDPYAFIRSQHVLALCSDLEAMPLSLLEAFASGRGVVCRDLPGIREVVTEACGMIIDSDTPEDWSRALKFIHVDGARLWGSAARRRYMDAFTMEQLVARTELVYQRALERTPV